MKKITISLNDEYREIFIDGRVIRHMNNGRIIKGSSNWYVTGFSLINNFGHTTKSLSIMEFFKMFEENKNALFYKNEKPKFVIHDCDHGTPRIWGIKRKKYHYNLIK